MRVVEKHVDGHDMYVVVDEKGFELSPAGNIDDAENALEVLREREYEREYGDTTDD